MIYLRENGVKKMSNSNRKNEGNEVYQMLVVAIFLGVPLGILLWIWVY